MLGIHGIDCVVQDCNIQGGSFLHLQNNKFCLNIVKDLTTIEACGLDTRLETRFNGSGNEVMSKIQMREMQQQMNITTWMKSF